MLMIIVLSNKYGHCSLFKGLWEEYGEFLKLSIGVAGIVTAYLFFTKSTFSRLWIFATWILVITLVPIARVLVKRWMMKQGKWFSKALVIGSGHNALESALAIESNILMGFKVVGLVDVSQKESEKNKAIVDKFNSSSRSFPVYCFDDDLIDGLDKFDQLYLVLALESDEYIKHQRVIEKIVSTRRNLSVIPPLRGFPLFGTEISPIFKYEVLHLRLRNNLANKGSRSVKRLFDVLVSLVLLVMLSPLILFLYIRIKKDGGTAFFAQSRIGQGGKIFSCYKFRSMFMNADELLQALLKKNEHLKKEYKRDHCCPVKE